MQGFIRRVRPLLVGAFLVGAAASSVTAQVPFLGSTKACFYRFPATTCAPAWSTTIPSGFWATNLTNPGQTVQAPFAPLFFMNENLSFMAPLGTTQFKLGEFSFGGGVPVLDAFFLLEVTLSQPGTNTLPYTAHVTGALAGHTGTPVTVDFNPSAPGLDWTQGPFTFVGGTYAVTALGSSYNPDEINQPLYGVATVTPEPGVITLLGTGLAGLAAALRRRRNRKV